MNAIDSPAWLAYIAGDANAGTFAPAIEATDSLIVPGITIYEVYRRLRVMRTEFEALTAVVQMRLGRVVPLDEVLAIEGADLSIRHRLPMADSIILATARRFDATLWTQDADFDGIEGVRYVPA